MFPWACYNPYAPCCVLSLGRLSSPHSSVTLRLLHMHYNRGSQVMNICVWPAVKISLITARLESKVAYLAGQQAAGLSIQPPGDHARSHVVLCYGKAYLLYLSLLFLSVSLLTRFQVTPSPLKRINLLKEAKKSFYCPVAQSNCDMSAGACYGC